MKEYLVYGEYGCVTGQYREQIITAESAEAAKTVFIQSMQDDPIVWGRMGAHNVHVQEYVPAKARKKIGVELDRPALDLCSLSTVVEKLETYKDMIIDRGGISDSGYIDLEEYGYDNGFEIVIKYYRFETDSEYDDRITSEATARAKGAILRNNQEGEERKELARLKKKFGDT